MQGLQNLGSTCAINSLLQIICRTKQLRDSILEYDIPDNTIAFELKEILDLMHNKNHSLSPKKFIRHLYQHFDGIFRLGEQLDIGELWMFLFDKIHSEISKDIIIPTYIDNDISKEHLINKCNETVSKLNNNKTSKWLESSQGIILNIIHCKKCGKQLHNFEPFTSIPLDIVEDDNINSLAEMFRNFLKSQEGCGDWKCENCNDYTNYTKIIKLWKLPPVLIFIIKRFINVQMKNIKPISINQTLSIKTNEENNNYTCTSMALHYGGISGGHYCAICKVNDNDYILYDDLNYTVLNYDNINNIYSKNRDAYMIVYTL
jgi:ubiquitin C-terminal hydrolase